MSNQCMCYINTQCWSVVFKPFKAQWLLHVPLGLTLKNFSWCSHCIYIFCIDLRTNRNPTLYNIKWLVFLLQLDSVYCAICTKSLYNTITFLDFKLLPCYECCMLYSGSAPTLSPSFLLAQAIFEPNLFPYKYSNILKPSHSSYLSTYEDGTECSETLAHKIQTTGNYPEESTQHNYISSFKGTTFQNETTKMQRIRFTLHAK
jgi:hypothetical protein